MNQRASDERIRGPRVRVGAAVPGGAAKGPEPMVVDPAERKMSRSEARAVAKLTGADLDDVLGQASDRSTEPAAKPVEHAAPECLRPDPNVLVKLGSLMVHADEITSPDAHELDAAAIRGLLADPELVAWREQMNALAFLPVMRSAT